MCATKKHIENTIGRRDCWNKERIYFEKDVRSKALTMNVAWYHSKKIDEMLTELKIDGMNMCLLNTQQLWKDLRQCIMIKWKMLKQGMKCCLMLEKGN